MCKNKLIGLLCCLFFCLLSGGCKNEDKMPVVTLQEIWTEYGTEDNVLAYTLDEDGNLYTFEFVMKAPKDADRFFLRRYGAKGEREYSKALDDGLGSYVKTMAVKDVVVYFVPYIPTDEGISAVLYSYCPGTEELTRIKELPYFVKVNRIIPMGDFFYLLGTNIEILSGSDTRKYEHTGEKIFCYTISDGSFAEIGIEEPIDICAAEEGKLCVYAHMGDEFCLLLYDTEKDSMKMMAKTKEYKMANVAFCSDRQEVIYPTTGRGLVLSSLSDLDAESELYPDSAFWDYNIRYVNGKVVFETFEGKIVSFPLKDVKRDNKALCYIADKVMGSEPFGCGYEIQRNILEEDKFALKVMALDRDFDVCYVDSRDPFSYNLREHGVFYPLNEIEGINEYLDACFPYVREAATDRDGNIWMLPVEVNIRGLIVRSEEADKVLFRNDMTYEEYCLEYEALSEEEKKFNEKPASFAEKFIVQYILDRGTVNTEEFRYILQGMLKSKSVQTEDTSGIYWYVYDESDYRTYSARQYGADACIYAEPKLSADDKNVGTCSFLAVNPYSDNLDETLQYIATLIAYMMNREQEPLFFENRKVGDNLYDRSLYELYRNGAVAFYVDDDVYEGYFDIQGKDMSVDEYVTKTETKVKTFLNE